MNSNDWVIASIFAFVCVVTILIIVLNLATPHITPQNNTSQNNTSYKYTWYAGNLTGTSKVCGVDFECILKHKIEPHDEVGLNDVVTHSKTIGYRVWNDDATTIQCPNLEEKLDRIIELLEKK